MSSDSYVTVDAVFQRRTTVQLDRDNLFEKVWVPSSCLHAASDDVVENAVEGARVSLRMREWVAEEKGLL